MATRKKRARSQRPRSRGKGAEPSDRQPFPASVVSETGKGILLRVTRPEGGEAEIWFPRAAVQPLAGGQWLISRAALEAKEEAAAEVSKADAVFGKDFLPVYGEIIEATEKAYKVKLMVSWGSSNPRPWRGYVPITQAKFVPEYGLCLTRWIIGQKQDELFARGMPGPQGGGGRVVADEFMPRPVIEIDEEAIARAVMGPGEVPGERPTVGPATPAKAKAEPGRLF